MNSFAWLTICFTIILIGTGCMVPIQLNRVTLTERFTQNFDFGATAPEDLTPILKDLLGLRYDSLINNSKEVKKKFNKAKNFISEGSIVFTLSLVPNKDKRKKPMQFFISGFGFYDIIDTSEDRVYFSSRLHIDESIHYNLNDLKTENSITIKFDQIITNQFELINSTPEQEMFVFRSKKISVVVKLNNNIIGAKNKPLFSLDYKVPHQVLMDGKPLGKMKFYGNNSGYNKIIDIRGKNLTRRDYHNYSKYY